MKVKVVFVMLFVFSLVGLGFQPVQATEISPAQVSPDCYRQIVYSWTEDQTVTTFSVMHVKKNGKTPAVSCGAIAKTDLYKWREFFDLGVKCWSDMCIQNWIVNDKQGGPDKYWTKVTALNGYKLVHLGIWNQR